MVRPNNIAFETRKLSELQPDPKNAKLHPVEQVEAIARNIEEFGMLDPITITPDNLIIAGHGRFLACKSLGMEEVPVYVMEHLDTEAKVLGYGLAHNQVAMSSGLDYEALSRERENFGLTDQDLMATGMTSDDIFNITTFMDMMSAAEQGSDGKFLADKRAMDGHVDKVYRASLDFDEEAEYKMFQSFVTGLRYKYPNAETMGARLALFMDEVTDEIIS